MRSQITSVSSKTRSLSEIYMSEADASADISLILAPRSNREVGEGRWGVYVGWKVGRLHVGAIMMPSPFFPLLTRQRQGCLQPLVITVLMNVTRCAIVRCGCGVIKAFLTSEETCVCVCVCEGERGSGLCVVIVLLQASVMQISVHIFMAAVCVCPCIFLCVPISTRACIHSFLFFSYLRACTVRA